MGTEGEGGKEGREGRVDNAEGRTAASSAGCWPRRPPSSPSPSPPSAPRGSSIRGFPFGEHDVAPSPTSLGKREREGLFREDGYGELPDRKIHDGRLFRGRESLRETENGRCEDPDANGISLGRSSTDRVWFTQFSLLA